MYDKTITIFNFHEATRRWHMTVVKNANVEENVASSGSTRGNRNGDLVDILIPTDVDRSIRTDQGFKPYVHPKEYARCSNPESVFTLNTEKDFLYVGLIEDREPVDEDLFESGLYNQMNEDYDGVYLINSALHLGLLPHFEVSGG